MRRFSDQKKVLPSFPRTPHLPWSFNRTDDDVVIENDETQPLFDHPVSIEEKVDGASVGMTLWEGHPLIRNRDHILRKGYVKDTPAKKQFAPIWNWFYKNKKKFEYIRSRGTFSVYGEWMVGRHGIFYDQLPDWFVAYDIYDYEIGKFVSPTLARTLLNEAGFSLPQLLFQGHLKVDSPDDWTGVQSPWSNELIEGAYFKTYNSEFVLDRFKQVRESFERGKFWDGKTLLKNEVES